MRHSPHTDRAHHAALVRGVAVNVAGLVAKLGGPALLLIVTRLFGPAITGVFLLTQLLAELARSVIVSGYNDAVTIFGSREAGTAANAGCAEAGVYRVIAGVLRAVLASSVLLALLAYVFADPIAQLFPAQADLAIAIRYAALALRSSHSDRLPRPRPRSACAWSTTSACGALASRPRCCWLRSGCTTPAAACRN